MRIGRSDFLKILDAVTAAGDFFVRRDEMNGAVHLAKDVRYSPVTSTVLAARDRMVALLNDQKDEPHD